MEILIIRELVRKAKAYGLDFGRDIADMSDEEIAAVYNGIGPEWMPRTIRARLTSEWSELEPAAMIHDIDYGCADGSAASFHAANERLRDNIRKTADTVATRFFSLKWWKLRLAASVCFEAVERFGLPAYLIATENKTKGITNE